MTEVKVGMLLRVWKQLFGRPSIYEVRGEAEKWEIQEKRLSGNPEKSKFEAEPRSSAGHPAVRQGCLRSWGLQRPRCEGSPGVGWGRVHSFCLRTISQEDRCLQAEKH